MTKQELIKQFDEKYLESVYKAYPDYKESHTILLNDIKSFLLSSIEQVLKAVVPEERDYIWDNRECNFCGHEGLLGYHPCELYNNIRADIISKAEEMGFNLEK